MTVKKKVLFVVPVVLLLALCVAPCMAVNVDLYGGEYQTASIGSADSVTINILDDVGSRIYLGCSAYAGTSSNAYFTAGVTNANSVTIPLQSGYNSVKVVFTGRNPQVDLHATITISYTYQEPTPEPTPVPSPYISVTELYSDNLGTVYRFQCLPDDNRVLYSNIVPYIIPAYMAPSYAGELTSSQTSIEYRVPAGGTSEFSAVYVTAPFTVGVISTTVTAPALTPAENQTYNPIPDPAQKPLTPFTSGKFQPTLTSGQVDVISKSPYVALLSNLNQSMQLPIMDSPDSIRNKLVPDDLENITGPLYDTAAGWAEFTNFVPRLIADTMIGVYSPFLSAIADCKSVLLSFTGQLAELMKPVYILSPVFYLFIPDLVWIGVCLVLVLLIIHALLVFVLGEDTVVYFMGRDTIVADAIPDFPALEK